MIPVSEASGRILARIQPLPQEPVATERAAGLVLAERVIAPITSPPHDNSSMDGYAARSADLGADFPRLRLVETVAAGGFPSRPLAPGETMRVMTGAPVPAGADSVIRREDTDEAVKDRTESGGVRHDVVTVMNRRDSGRNIRRAGEDFRAGDVLFGPGEELRVPHLGVLASAGIRAVAVHRRPRVAIISSGDELVELRDFEPSMAGRKVVSANSVTLTALVRDAGGEPVDLGIARDAPASVREKFDSARGCDLIVTSAGISVGDHDYVRDVFAALGGELDFWKVRMRPGAPLAFGMLGGTPWIGLSGNPVSAIVTFEVFVRPVIRRMLGLRNLFRRTIPVRVSQSMTLAAPLMHFLRVVITSTSDGAHAAALAGPQSSAVLTALARADALLIIPGDRLDIAAGETHRALPLVADATMCDELVLT